MDLSNIVEFLQNFDVEIILTFIPVMLMSFFAAKFHLPKCMPKAHMIYWLNTFIHHVRSIVRRVKI